MRPVVHAHAVTVRRAGVNIVDGADLSVGKGDWVTIVGPNGAGKTTLLRAIAGLISSDGRVELDGELMQQLAPRARARRVAYVAQQPVMPAGMTVAHYVLLGRTAHLRPLARESNADRAVVDDVLRQLELTAMAARFLSTLSGGERQRAALARGLAQNASLLLLDEPTAALDIGHQQELLDLVEQLRRERGITVVTTMHDLTLAAQYGDHLVLMDKGRITLSGPPAHVLTNAQLEAHYGARVDVIRHRGHYVVVPVR